MTHNKAIADIISEQVAALNRPDLYREPLMEVSGALDPRYEALKTIIGPWHQTPRELLPEALSVISYFVPYTKELTAQPRLFDNASPLWGEAYILINEHFDRIAQEVSDYLTPFGYVSMGISGTHTYDPKNLKSMWSHRSAGAISGLGTFAANLMMITAKGSSGRFCTILTSAPLDINSKEAPELCPYLLGGSCGLCFEACPVKALQPESFDPFLCHNKVLMKNVENLKSVGYCDVCGKCISVCPFAYME